MVAIALTIAGSDSGGGAGLQADLKAFTAYGIHGTSAVTAVTAQNTYQVSAVYPTPLLQLQEQLATLQQDLLPDAVKTGLLVHADIVKEVATFMRQHRLPLVVDPVLVATSGDRLAHEHVKEAYEQWLFPLASLITPNMDEAAAFLGHPIRSRSDMQQAAKNLLDRGAKAVLLKGGDDADSAEAWDYFTDGSQSFWLGHTRYAAPFHGTGCTLSAAITAGIAQGLPLIEAIVKAKAYISASIAQSIRPGTGAAVLTQTTWPVASEFFPHLTHSMAEKYVSRPYATMDGAPIGLYPIVDRVEWLKRLLPLGIQTCQLRIKDLSGETLEREIAAAVELARTYRCRLFINDYEELAIKYQAYGVHLGQEDLNQADLSAIQEAGLRLGISTHSYEEAARAITLQPSYIALGPIFPTTAKVMRFGPQGLQRLQEWVKLFPYPVVAIGGIQLKDAAELLRCGVNGVALISDITQNEKPEERVRAWLAALTPLKSL